MPREITQVTTLYTIREETTDGHAPVLFHCADGENYFCKYRIKPRPSEIYFLAFEVVANRLLKRLAIPTPDIAFVEVQEGTLNRKLIKVNKRIKENMQLFGSKELSNVKLVDDFSLLQSKHDFNQLLNPEDIIRIAIFDHWVKNNDRGKALGSGHNYNLLLQSKSKKLRIVAFDHAFIFGEDRIVGDFSYNIPTSNYSKLASSPFYLSVIKYIEEKDFLEIANNFITLLHHDYSKLISQTLAQLPSEWGVSNDLDQKIIDLLHSKERIEGIKKLIIHSKS